MIKLLPLLLMLAYGFVTYRLSVWRSRRELDARSSPLRDPDLGRLTDRMARALDLKSIPVHLYDVPVVNGLAAPDGRIFITRGFYDKFRGGEDLACLLYTSPSPRDS